MMMETGYRGRPTLDYYLSKSRLEFVELPLDRFVHEVIAVQIDVFFPIFLRDRYIFSAFHQGGLSRLAEALFTDDEPQAKCVLKVVAAVFQELFKWHRF